MNKYDYDPDIEFKIMNIGEMLEVNGCYSNSNLKGQRLLQELCHMIYQIRDEVRFSKNRVLSLGSVWLQWTPTYNGEHFQLFTDDYMTAFHIIMRSRYSFDIEFLSPNQLAKADPLLEYAYKHAQVNGKVM